MKTDSIIYFAKAGRSNTSRVLKEAKRYSVSQDIQTILVASSKGYTGVEACKVISPSTYNLIIITTHSGFRAPGELYLSPENRDLIEKQGGKLLIATHALSGIERSIRRDLGTWMPLELFAKVLRLFGEGTKVCVEITIMAADSHLVPMNRSDIIAIGGSGGGADTAWVVTPAHSNNFFDLKLKKLICKPEEW